MKKIFAIMLAVMFVMMLLPMSAFAAAGGSEVQEEAVGGEVNENANYTTYIYLAFKKTSSDSSFATTYYVNKSGTNYTAQTANPGTNMWTSPATYSSTLTVSSNMPSTSMNSAIGWYYTGASSSTYKVSDLLPSAISGIGSGTWALKGIAFKTSSQSSISNYGYSTATTWSALRDAAKSYALNTNRYIYICFEPGAAATPTPAPATPTPAPTLHVRVRHMNNGTSSIMGDTYLDIQQGVATTITASSVGSCFDHDNYTYSFFKWTNAGGTMTFGSAYSATTTVTITAVDSTFHEARIGCYWTVSEITRPDHTFIIKTTVNGTEIASTETMLREQTGSMTIAPDKTTFNYNAYNYTFNGWTVTSGTIANANAESTTFTMGTADATATAAFTAVAKDNPTTGGGSTDADGGCVAWFYILYVDDSFNLGYDYDEHWDVHYHCQDVTCPGEDHTSSTHSIACSVIKAQMDAKNPGEGWEFVGWTKTASADPTIYTTYTGNTTTTNGTNYQIFLVAKKDADATAEKTFTVQYKVSGTTQFSTDVTLTRPVWEDVTINAADYMAQAGVTGYALTGDTTYTHAWATWPSSVDFNIELSVAPFTVNGTTITSTYTDYTQLSALGYAIGHKTEYVASEFKDFRKKLTVTVPGLSEATEVTVYTAPRGGEARLDYVVLTPTAAAATISVAYNNTTRRIEVTDTEHLIKSMWFAQGHFTKYADMKVAPGFKNITNKWYYNPLVSAESLEYTYYMKMVDGTYCYKYITLDPTACPDIVIEVSDLTVFVSDDTAEYVKTMYVAKGHYDTENGGYTQMKADRATNGYKAISQAKCHTFSGVSVITEVTVCYKDLNGGDYKFQHVFIEPEFSVIVTMDGTGKVTVAASTGVDSDIKSVYYASGFCTTYAQMKVATVHKSASKHYFTPDFSVDTVYTLRVVTSDGNTLYYTINSNGTIVDRQA